MICDRFPERFPIPVVPVAWDEQTEARELAAGQIGVSWLPDDLWSRGKCGLKVLQYQAAGLPVVANPVGSHREMIRDGETGFLATTPDEWVDAVRRLAGDARLRQKMGLAGPPAGRGGLLGLGLGRDLRHVDDRDIAGHRSALPGKSIGPPPSRRRLRVSNPRRQGPKPIPNSQPDRRSMSLCTPHERSTVRGRSHDVDACEKSGPRSGIRADVQASGLGVVAVRGRRLVVPGWLGRTCCWVPDGLRLDEWRDEGRLTTIKSGPHRIVYRVDLPQGTIYIKHFLVPDWRAMLRQWVRRGKGRNEGKRSQHLATIGVPTITPIALGEQRKRKFLFENYLVTLEISAATPLDEFVERQLPEWPEPIRSQIRQKLAEAMAVMTARLHNAGLLHQDFHPGNILVRFAAEPARARAGHDRSGCPAEEPAA